MAEAKLTLDSQLPALIQQMTKLRDANKEVGKSFEQSSKIVGEGIRDQAKKTETYFNRTKDLGRELASSLKDSFKVLAGLSAIGGALDFGKNL
jgi:hypothetical protein